MALNTLCLSKDEVIKEFEINFINESYLTEEIDLYNIKEDKTYFVKGVSKDKTVKRKIFVHPSCINTIKELQQWKWKKDERTSEYLDEPVPIMDDAMAALRYGIESWRKQKKWLY